MLTKSLNYQWKHYFSEKLILISTTFIPVTPLTVLNTPSQNIIIALYYLTENRVRYPLLTYNTILCIFPKVVQKFNLTH